MPSQEELQAALREAYSAPVTEEPIQIYWNGEDIERVLRELKVLFTDLRENAASVARAKKRDQLLQSTDFFVDGEPEQQFIDLLLEYGALIALQAGKLPKSVIQNGLRAFGVNPKQLPPEQHESALQALLWHLTDDQFLSWFRAESREAAWRVYASTLLAQPLLDEEHLKTFIGL